MRTRSCWVFPDVSKFVPNTMLLITYSLFPHLTANVCSVFAQILFFSWETLFPSSIPYLYPQTSFFFKKRFYLFIFRERGREGEKGRETSMCGCLSCTPHWGPGPEPRHVPWLGIEPVTLWFSGCHLIHWATPARAMSPNFSYRFDPWWSTESTIDSSIATDWTQPFLSLV